MYLPKLVRKTLFKAQGQFSQMNRTSYVVPAPNRFPNPLAPLPTQEMSEEKSKEGEAGTTPTNGDTGSVGEGDLNPSNLRGETGKQYNRDSRGIAPNGRPASTHAASLSLFSPWPHSFLHTNPSSECVGFFSR